jgi:hypothetical protein
VYDVFGGPVCQPLRSRKHMEDNGNITDTSTRKITLDDLKVSDDTAKRAMAAKQNLTHAAEMFPAEKWTQSIDGNKIGDGFYIAESRIPQTDDRQHQEWQKLRKEITQSEILLKNGFSVALLPEKDSLASHGTKNKRKIDALVDSKPTELKTIVGRPDKIWQNFKNAREKSTDQINVYLEIQSKQIKSLGYVKETLRSRILEYNKKGNGTITDGIIYVRLGNDGELQTWDVRDLLK